MTHPLATLATTLATAAPPGSAGKTLLDHINSGGVIGYVIILLSLVATVLLVVHLHQIREARLAPAELVERLNQLFRAGDVRGAIQYCQAPENDTFVARIVGAALVRCARSPFGFLELKAALQEAGQEQVERLYRATDGIGLIAAVAPMLGLLGTVVGMVGAFDTIASSQGFASPDQLAGDISQALITTVLGLVVAIPTTAVFTFLRNRIDAITADIASLIEDLAWQLESASQQQAGRPQPAPGQSPAQPAPAPASPQAPQPPRA